MQHPYTSSNNNENTKNSSKHFSLCHLDARRLEMQNEHGKPTSNGQRPTSNGKKELKSEWNEEIIISYRTLFPWRCDLVRDSLAFLLFSAKNKKKKKMRKKIPHRILALVCESQDKYFPRFYRRIIIVCRRWCWMIFIKLLWIRFVRGRVDDCYCWLVDSSWLYRRCARGWI